MVPLNTALQKDPGGGSPFEANSGRCGDLDVTRYLHGTEQFGTSRGKPWKSHSVTCSVYSTDS